MTTDRPTTDRASTGRASTGRLTPDRPVTLSGLLDAVAARNARATALVWNEGMVDFGDLAARSHAVAGGLAGLGLGPGDTLALWLPNGVACFELLFACARIGATAVAVNTRFRSAEVADLLFRSRARILAVDPGFRGIDFAGILADIDPAALDALEAVVDCGDVPAGVEIAGKPATGIAGLRAATDQASGTGSGEAGAIVYTTSGTTAAPKLVLHRQAGLTGHALDVATGFGLDAPEASSLQMLPLCGTFGLTQALGTLAAGRPVVLQAAFDAEEAVHLIERHAITHINGSDDMIARLLDAAGGGAALRSLHLCGYAAFNAALDDLPNRAREVALPLVGLYGMSEIHALFARYDTADPEPLRTTAGGRPVNPGARVRVVGEDGAPLAAGETGNIEIASPTGFSEYKGNPQATAAAFTGDGYFRTGDVGRLVDGGAFVFEARGGDVLRLGGFLVNPREIEAVIEAIDGIAGAQVVGVDTPQGTRPVAFVTAEEPAPAKQTTVDEAKVDEAAIMAACAHRLARFKVPARVVALDGFPVAEGANGTKIQRQKLREQAAGLLAGPPTSAIRRS